MPHLLRNNFTSGELAPELRLRPELDAYQSGLKSCRNYVVKPQGGIVSRPGTEHRSVIQEFNTPEPNDRVVRLIPFVFSEQEAYVIGLKNSGIVVFKDGIQLGGNSSPQWPFPSNLSDTEIWGADYAQSADIITLTVEGFAPIAIERHGNTNWQLRVITFDPQALAPTNLTLTAVGSGAGDFDKTYKYVVTAVYEATGEESFPSSSDTITTKSLSVTAGIKLTWDHAEASKVAYYRVYKSTTGASGTFGWIGDAENQEFEDYNLAPLLTDSPPEVVIAPDTPRCVTYYQQRQIFGNLFQAPLSFVASRVANPENFQQSRPIQADDAFSVTASTPEFNAIRFLIPLDSLLVLTTGSELRTTEGDSQVFTPSTVGVRRLSNEGCSSVKPTLAGSTLLYVQSSEDRVRAVTPSGSGGYIGTDMTLLARHLFRGEKIKQIAFSAEPYGILWCVTEDGGVLAFTYKEAQGVQAWHHHEFGGWPYQDQEVESVVVIPEDNEDVPYFLVRRHLQGSGDYRWSLERIKFQDEVYGMDSWAKSVTGWSDVHSGFGHLQGGAITVVADGNLVEGLTVNAQGEIHLPWPAITVRAGLAYTCRADLLPVTDPKVERSQPKSISEVVAYVHETRGLWVGALREDEIDPTMWQAYPRDTEDDYDVPPLYTGGLDVLVGGPWTPDSNLRVEQRAPFRSEILAIEYHLDL